MVIVCANILFFIHKNIHFHLRLRSLARLIRVDVVTSW